MFIERNFGSNVLILLKMQSNNCTKVLLSELAPYSICKELYCKLDILITKVVKAFWKFEYYKYGSSPELVLILSRPCSTVTATVESVLILVEDHYLHADLAVLIRDPFPLRDGNARFRGPLHLCRQILRFLFVKALLLEFEVWNNTEEKMLSSFWICPKTVCQTVKVNITIEGDIRMLSKRLFD